MELKFKRLSPDAKIPSYATSMDVGLDVHLTHLIKVENGVHYFGTGLAVEPSDGYYVEIHPRSSLPKRGWMLANSTGIIDPGYRGELIVALVPVGDPVHVELPARYVQLVTRKIYRPHIHVVDELSDTDRGDGGFGSTD